MEVTLKPLSHKNTGEILVEDTLLAVGRSEPCFAAYDAKTLAYLSRRHARIFCENGQAYIADLGSRNGTKLNNRALAFTPEQLHSGDQITFANTLQFEVTISHPAGENHTQQPAPFHLTLVPLSEEFGDQALTITQFPFMVGNSNANLIPAETSAENALKFLSRRHAHFFLKGDELYLEDLGSTNGTFVNDERLDEHARLIKTGDHLKFGSPHCEFEAKLQTLDESAEAVVPDPQGEQTFHTAFVSAADSFLDIFCIEDDDAQLAVAEDEPEHPVAVSKTGTGKPKRGFLHRTRSFLRELKGAFAEQEAGKGRSKWIYLVLFSFICVAIVLRYTMNTEQKDIRALFEDKQYQQATEAANQFLLSRPDDQDTNELAIKALMKHTVSAWLASIESRDHTAAFKHLAVARSMSTNIEGSSSLIELLEWTTRLDQYIQERGGPEAPIRIFSDEDRIIELLDWWDADADKHRGTARLILNYAPEFDDINLLTYSYLRTLGTDKSVYLTAIDKLKHDINTHLTRNQAAELTGVFTAYASQYPRLGGMPELVEDLSRFLPLEAAIKAHDFDRAANIIDATEFLTPPFVARVEQLLLDMPEVAKTSGEYESASDAWLAGDFDQALVILEDLSLQPGEELPEVHHQLEHKRSLLEEYRSLQSAQADPGYAERLIRFHRRLEPAEDAYLINSIATEFALYSGKLLKTAESSWSSAQRLWSAYREQGGIGGLLRLEETVSAEFTRQVKTLNSAYDSAHRAAQMYAILGKDTPPERNALRQRIEAEIELQRRSLEQLSIVLGKDLLDKKLGLLVNIQPN